ncbi:MAG: hypothetical protein OEM85_14790 [Gammaproteobacteria bacterium]|nr:hypothetical protein [Gammaproteobacteria bacterium]MDH3374630.1 hypothetical protein [Gammaproteobacteria bacterium]MDH3410106.1 hypothetical protein [Gammaproteobacteria bacterium]
MLRQLQRQLSDIYQVGRTHDVRDYLITDPTLAKVLSQDAVLKNTDETLLVSHDDEGLALSLFLDAGMIGRLESSDPLTSLRAECLDDLWKVLEGISHFNCVVWKATQDRTVTLLELELQGEIDKFVTTMMLALDQADTELLNRLHGWLFDNVSFHAELDEEQLDRYRSANDYAARFCHGLRQQMINDDQLALSELRQFFRLQMADKISHIHSQAWSAS